MDVNINSALAALKSVYGHTKGAEDLFHTLMSSTHSKNEPSEKEKTEEKGFVIPEIELFSSHPLTEKRIENIKAKGNQKGKLTPLKVDFKNLFEMLNQSESNGSGQAVTTPK